MRRKKGATPRERVLTTPPCWPILRIPIQRASTPVRPREISKPFFAAAKVELRISEKISVCPNAKNWTQPMMTASKISPIQI